MYILEKAFIEIINCYVQNISRKYWKVSGYEAWNKLDNLGMLLLCLQKVLPLDNFEKPGYMLSRIHTTGCV